MPTLNDAPNADTGVKKDEKPKKDGWDKIDIAIKALIPVAVAFAGWWIQGVVTTQNTGKDYMQIALGILEKKDLTEDMQKNKGLRQWAVNLLQYYSPVKLDESTSGQLITGEVKFAALWNDSWDVYNPLVVSAPHGGRVASVTEDGELTVHGLFTDQTQLKSPRALVFSEDGEYLLVYNARGFALYYMELGTIRGEKHVLAPIRRSLQTAISTAGFSDWLNGDNHVKMIIVRGTDSKQTRYDLDGNEIR